MFLSQWYTAPSMTGFSAASVGQPVKSLLLNNRKTYCIVLALAAIATVAGGALTAIVGGGSLLNAFDEVGFMDNGVKQIQLDPRFAGALTGALMPSARTRTVITSTANGVTNLKDNVILFFGQPYQLDPWETAYCEQDPKAELAAYVIPNASITTGAALGTVGAGTLVISAVNIDVCQYYSLDIATRPLLVPFVETRDFGVSVSGPQQEVSLRTQRFLSGLGLMADSIQGGVRVLDTTIISALALRSDNRYIVGEGAMSLNLLQAMNDQFQGESFVGTSFLYLRFQEFGRLSRVLDPRADSNLRWIATLAPSSVGGATSSRIRSALLGLQRIAGVTAKVVPFLDGAEAVATS